MRVDGVADVRRIGAHLDGQRNLRDQVAGMHADDGAADDAMGFLVEDQLGEAFAAADADRAAAVAVNVSLQQAIRDDDAGAYHRQSRELHAALTRPSRMYRLLHMLEAEEVDMDNMQLLNDGVKVGLTAFASVMGVLALLYFFVRILQKFDVDDKGK